MRVEQPVERRTSFSDRRAGRRGGRRFHDYAGRPVVLIVEDHVDSRELLSAVLQETGVAVAEAGTGKEGLTRAVREPRPSLILLDLSLPDCHGTQVLRVLKEDPATRDIPVITLSASVGPADRRGASEAGSIAFIAKPLMPDRVVGIVRQVLLGTA